MRHARHLGLLSLSVVWLTCGPAVKAIDITIDYRYDTDLFFDESTADGQAARATIEEAASFFSTIIIDTLDAIPFTDPNPPSPFFAPVWRQIFRHPGTGQEDFAVSSAADASVDGLTIFDSIVYPPADEFRDIQIGADEILIYVGGTDLDGPLGEATTGFGAFGSQGYLDNITLRGKSAGEYSTWGGSITFDNDANVNWNHSFSSQPGFNEADLFSVSLHEIGHILGLSSNNSAWNAWQVGAEFRGPEALAAWSAEDPNAPSSATGIPTVNVGDRHWKDNAPGPADDPSVSSYVLGTTTLQEAAMDPNLLGGTRKLFTNVDTYALRDIDWTIPSSVFAAPDPPDFDGDGDVDGVDLALWEASYGVDGNGDADGDTDGQDFLIWQREYTGPLPVSTTTVVPEPTALTLFGCAAIACCWGCRGRGRHGSLR